MNCRHVPLHGLDLDFDNSQLSSFLEPLCACWTNHRSVRIDLSSCQFLCAFGAAILGAFALNRRSWGGETEIEWNTGRSDVLKQFGRWRLTGLFGGNNPPWTDNAIPLFHQNRRDTKSVIGYISTALQSGQNMPTMTDDLVRMTNRSLCELFLNVFEHAESPCGGIAIGQFYPNKKHVQFCVGDAGIGLVTRVQGAGYARWSGSAAIQWALEEGTSTKVGPGGLGLYLLQEFVKKNGGVLRIIANDAYYDQRGSESTTAVLAVPYPGTLIEVGLLIRENELYTIQSSSV